MLNMRAATTLAGLTSVVSGSMLPRQAANETTRVPNVVASQYDGYVFKETSPTAAVNNVV
jgi:hypothetical protein